MINEIVEKILQEANTRPGKDRVSALFSALQDIETEIIKIIVTARDVERRLNANENKR